MIFKEKYIWFLEYVARYAFIGYGTAVFSPLFMSVSFLLSASVRYPKKKGWSLGYPFCIWISRKFMQTRWEFEFRIPTTGKIKYVHSKISYLLLRPFWINWMSSSKSLKYLLSMTSSVWGRLLKILLSN